MGKGRAPTSYEYYRLNKSKLTYEKYKQQYIDGLNNFIKSGNKFERDYAKKELTRLRKAGKL